MLRIERYGKSRYWAVYDGKELVVVTLYKRGAQEVRRRLAAPPRAAAELRARSGTRDRRSARRSLLDSATGRGNPRSDRPLRREDGG